MNPRSLIIDIATAAIDGAAAYVPEPECPGNYKKPESIAQWHKEEKPKLIQAAADRAGLDLDLARLTALGFTNGGESTVLLCRTEGDEVTALKTLAALLKATEFDLLTYNGLSFDLPLLMRRARYLGIPFPKLNLDRYRTPHLDLMQLLSDRDPSRRRPLGFYVKRLGWTDLVKPLTGEEEAKVPQTGLWAELEASVKHDLEAVKRLAEFLEVGQ